MNILQISPQVPLPLDDGGKIGIYNITKHLALRGHKIDFVTYLKHSNYDKAYYELSKICNPFILEVKTDNSLWGAAKNLISNIPYNISKYHSEALRLFLIKYFRENSVDVVHIDHLHMAWVVKILRELTLAPVVLREHNLEMRIMERFAENQKNSLLKKYAKMQYRRFIKYEPEMCSQFNACVMISENDERLLIKLKKNINTFVIPAGVEREFLDVPKKKEISYSLFHIGSLLWQPNLDGLNWYLDEVFPFLIKKIPNVKLYVYGKGSNKIRLANNLIKNVEIVGYVENIWNEIADKQLAIVPLRIGGGIRIKIIELMALGKNIITTSIGKEGIDVKDGQHILIADNAEEFINKTIKFLNSEYDAAGLSTNSRILIQEKYTWNKIAEEFENVYRTFVN